MFTARTIFCLSFVLWLSASIAGMTVLWNHESQPGLAAEAPQRWPAQSRLLRDESGSTMLVWIHPRCPCSWATISELKRLMTHFPEDTECRIVLTRPAGCDQEFVESSLTRAIRQIPDVDVVVDDDQREAARFGVSTSGQVLLYGHDAALLFAGGITPGRGHEGDSVGTARLREIFRAGQNRIRVTNSQEASRTLVSRTASATDACQCSVYGCGLFASTRDQSESP